MHNKRGLTTLSFAGLLLISASYAETAAGAPVLRPKCGIKIELFNPPMESVVPVGTMIYNCPDGNSRGAGQLVLESKYKITGEYGDWYEWEAEGAKAGHFYYVRKSGVVVKSVQTENSVAAQAQSKLASASATTTGEANGNPRYQVTDCGAQGADVKVTVDNTIAPWDRSVVNPYIVEAAKYAVQICRSLRQPARVDVTLVSDYTELDHRYDLTDVNGRNGNRLVEATYRYSNGNLTESGYRDEYITFMLNTQELLKEKAKREGGQSVGNRDGEAGKQTVTEPGIGLLGNSPDLNKNESDKLPQYKVEVCSPGELSVLVTASLRTAVWEPSVAKPIVLEAAAYGVRNCPLLDSDGSPTIRVQLNTEYTEWDRPHFLNLTAESRKEWATAKYLLSAGKLYEANYDDHMTKSNLLSDEMYRNAEAQKAEDKERESRQNAQEAADRQAFVAFLRKAKVKQFVESRKIEANPFLYEKQVVLVGAWFRRMQSRTDAYFVWQSTSSTRTSFIVRNVPPTMFTSPDPYYALAIQVEGVRKEQTGFGELSVPQVLYIAAVKTNESDEWIRDRVAEANVN